MLVKEKKKANLFYGVVSALGVNCLEKNTQAQLTVTTVTIHSGSHSVTLRQLFSANKQRALAIRLKLFAEEILRYSLH